MNKQQVKNHKNKLKQTYMTNAKQYRHVKVIRNQSKLRTKNFQKNEIKFNELNNLNNTSIINIQ